MTEPEIKQFDAFLKMLKAHGRPTSVRFGGVEVTFAEPVQAAPDPKKMEEIRRAFEAGEMTTEQALFYSVGEGLPPEQFQDLVRRLGG